MKNRTIRRRNFRRSVPLAELEIERVIAAQRDVIDPTRVYLVLKQGCLKLRKIGTDATPEQLARLGLL